MNRRIIIIIPVALAIALIAGIVCFVSFRGPNDPVYQGKRLSEWLKQSLIPGASGTEADEALRHYGSNAVPMLKAMLEKRDSKLTLKMLEILSKQRLIKFSFEPAIVVNYRAVHACNIIGPGVSEVIPAITNFVEHPPTNNMWVFWWRGPQFPLDTLAVMGPDGIAALIDELNSKTTMIRWRAANLLGTAPGSGTPEVIAALNQCFQSTNFYLADRASDSLKILRQRQQFHLPASATNWIDVHESDAKNFLSVWDTSQGVRVVRTSGLEQGQGTWVPEDLFGTRKSRVISGETGSLVFDNNKADGAVHSIEWEIPDAVTVRSFGFLAGHDSAEAGFQRAMREFRLYAREAGDDKFKLIYSEPLTVPYGAGREFSMLFLFRNLEKPVTAREFRAEFVQNGSGPYDGPRAMQLYGFTNVLNWPMIYSALQNQSPATQFEALRYFGKNQLTNN